MNKSISEKKKDGEGNKKQSFRPPGIIGYSFHIIEK
jgi:hypothetical protein